VSEPLGWDQVSTIGEDAVAKQPAPKEKKRPKNAAAQAARKAKKAAKKAN
jgi:hypothetical protein